MKNKNEKMLLCAVGLFCFLVYLVAGIIYNNYSVKKERESTTALIESFCDSIDDKLRADYNYTDRFSCYLLDNPKADIKDAPVYNSVMAHPEVLGIQVLTKEKQDKIKISADSGKDDMNYPFRLANLRREYIVYGPVHRSEYDRDVFLTVLPLYSDDELICSIMITLDKELILPSFKLDQLSDRFGLDYQLWTVSGETGEKVVLGTTFPNGEYSDVVETSFEMPTKWFMIARPVDGWGISIPAVIFTGLLFSILLTTLLHFCIRYKWNLHEIERIKSIDPETQFLNRPGFMNCLESGNGEKTVFIFEIFPFQALHFLPTGDREKIVQEYVALIRKYQHTRVEIARIEDGAFAVIFDEKLNEQDRENVERELEVDLIRPFLFNDERITLRPMIRHFCFTKRTGFERELEQAQREIWLEIYKKLSARRE